MPRTRLPPSGFPLSFLLSHPLSSSSRLHQVFSGKMLPLSSAALAVLLCAGTQHVLAYPGGAGAYSGYWGSYSSPLYGSTTVSKGAGTCPTPTGTPSGGSNVVSNGHKSANLITHFVTQCAPFVSVLEDLQTNVFQGQCGPAGERLHFILFSGHD